MGAAVGPALVSFFTSKAIGVVIIRTILVNVALGALTRRMMKRRDPQPPLSVTIRGTIERRRIVLGTRRCGGVFVYYNTSGTNQSVLWYVIVLAGHQVSSITDIWLDNILIPNSDINGGTGAVTAGQFSGKVTVTKFLGTGAQAVHTDLDSAFSEWTTDHRLRGCSYIVVKMQRSDEAFPSGAPQAVSALVNGALLYDPRKDSTNGGSGTHRRDDPSTWEFGSIGRNPALQARWYLTGGSVVNDQTTRMVRYGLREIDSRILDSYTIAAANICDESISGANAPPSGTQPRYCCDLELSCGETRREILESILVTMAGEAINEHGQWRIYAGSYDTPTHSLTQDDLYGDLEIQDTEPHESRYNAVSATYVNAAKQYVEQTTPFRTDSSYEAQDGGERITRLIDLRGVTDLYQAQRLCEIELRRSRMMRTVRLVGALNLLKIAKHETCNYSHTRYGWSSRIFRCKARQFEFNEEAGRVVITARREDPAVYADMLTSDYVTGTSETDVFVSDGPDAPASLTIQRFREQLLFEWTFPAFRGPVLYTEIWQYSAQTPFSSASKVWEGVGNSAVIKDFSREPQYFWIRHRNEAGQVSSTFPTTNGQAAQPLDALEEEFFDSFEHQDVLRFYNLRAGSPTISYPGNGESGGRVLRFQNYGWIAWKQNIPYEPTALYRMTVRAKMVQAPTNGQDQFWAGVEGVAADGETLINASGANSSGNQHYFAVAGFDFGGVTLGQWTNFGGYLGGHSASPGPMPAQSISNPCEMYSSGGTTVRFIRPLVILNYEGGDGIMEVDYIQLERVVKSEAIAPNSTSDANVASAPADGSIAYTSGTQPRIEVGGLNGSASYTSGGEATKVVVNWTAQARISNTTSGTAVGEARLEMKVLVNGSTVHTRHVVLEQYTASNISALLAGSYSFDVPAGQTIQATLSVYRSFSTSGSSPAQTIFWRAASINMVPLLK